ncbi:MAG: hypothetical protein KBC83_02980 [Candidatus Moranbacteria bacterium]|nr:hypothetical protein [Candidatus Moranbacteria bacterium]
MTDFPELGMKRLPFVVQFLHFCLVDLRSDQIGQMTIQELRFFLGDEFEAFQDGFPRGFLIDFGAFSLFLIGKVS